MNDLSEFSSLQENTQRIKVNLRIKENVVMGGLNHVEPSIFYRLSRNPQTSVSNNRTNEGPPHHSILSVLATQTNPQAAALACLQFGCVSHGGACSCATHFVFRVMLLLLFKAKGKSGAHVSTSSLFPPGRCSVITYRAHIHLKRLSLMFACLLIF